MSFPITSCGPLKTWKGSGYNETLVVAGATVLWDRLARDRGRWTIVDADGVGDDVLVLEAEAMKTKETT